MISYELEKIEANRNSSFAVNRYKGKMFTRAIHLHPEIEIVYIEEGAGECIVADSSTHFSSGDLFFFFANLPHHFKSDEQFHIANPNIESHSIYIQFMEGVLPANYLTMAGCTNIKSLIKASDRGLKWKGVGDSYSIVEKICQMESLDGFDRLHKLYELLNDMGLTIEQGEPISSSSYVLPKNSTDSNYYKIIQYINQNYREKITLESIAHHVGMNPSSLCRYFKAKAGESIFNYILDVRMAIVKEMLATTDQPISQIVYDTGFSSIPNFNSHFREVTKLTPTQYRNKMR
ncbi:MAG: AraC family transcriptional regulator [Rikenellaceae bacterium]